MKAGIYAITCLPTGERYVGASLDVRARWRSHRAKLNNKKHKNHLLQAAWSKHGAAAFRFEMIEAFASKELDLALRRLAMALVKAEQRWLKTKPAFNLATRAGLGTQTGRARPPATEATRAKLSASMKGNRNRRRR